MESEQILISIKDSARMLGIGKTKLYSLIASRQITAQKMGRRTFINKAEILRFAAALPLLSTTD